MLNVFGMIPVLDALSGKSTREADLDAPRLSFHDRVLELWVPTQLGLLAWTIYSLSTRPATQVEFIGITISMGDNGPRLAMLTKIFDRLDEPAAYSY